MHIASLLMAFFFRFMQPLIQAGNLYIGLSPLYRIKLGSGSREEEHWVYSDAEKEQVLKEKSARSTVSITRFKGLGEMNPSTLWDTTLNPKTRNIMRIRIDDQEMVAQVFENLMGKETGERYRLIQENAHRLEVDI